MDKNHDCISKVRTELKEANPDLGWIRFELSTIVNTSQKERIEKTGQAIVYSYEHTKKDGTKIQKTGKSFVSHSFCPFCGEKYPE